VRQATLSAVSRPAPARSASQSPQHFNLAVTAQSMRDKKPTAPGKQRGGVGAIKMVFNYNNAIVFQL
jgi:hypothetical protein